MSESHRHFEQFEDHSRLKHAILDAYVRQWAMITLAKGSRYQSACFCDAFAGAGSDQRGNPGSGLLAAKASSVVREAARAGAIRPDARLRIALVEQKRSHFDSLAACVEPFVKQATDDYLLLHGDYGARFREVRRFSAGAPLLTFIDPFGVDGLDARYYDDLLRGERDEAFILVSDRGAARLHGVLSANSDRGRDAVDIATQHLSLFPEEQEERVARLQHEADELQRHLDLQQPRAREILRLALGSDDRLAKLGSVSREQLPDEFIRQLVGALEVAGAKRVLLVPMRDAQGRYKYTLLHVAKSPRATRAMKDAVSSALNKEQLSEEMRSRIRADLELPLERFCDWIVQELSGKRFRWTSSDSQERGLKEILLEQTPLFTFQATPLRKMLELRGHSTKGGRALYFEF